MCKSTMSLRLDGLISSQYRRPGALAGCLSVTECQQQWSRAEEVFRTSRHLFPSASRLPSEHVWLLFYFFYFYLFRRLSPPATYIERSCPYMAVANVWPGGTKWLRRVFPSFVRVRVARQLRPAHFKDLEKSTAGFSRFPLGLPSFFAVCVHPSSGMAPFFVYFFERNRKLCQHTWKIWEKQLVFLVSQCPDLWLSVDV